MTVWSRTEIAPALSPHLQCVSFEVDLLDRLDSHRDFARISSECSNVVGDPLQPKPLVSQPKIRRPVISKLLASEEAKAADTDQFGQHFPFERLCKWTYR